ncbi:MAG: hypothetical protein K6F15_07375 [Treponema sp.]|nr:hypothetical protein [Treponema sp.]
MKKIANRLTIALTSLAILFAGCSNSIDGSMDSLKYSVLKSALNSSSSANTLTLNVTATTDDEYINFDAGRTITPDQIDSSALHFYLYGVDEGKQTNVAVKEVQFNSGASSFEGTVPVELDVSDYKLYLVATESEVTITGTTASYSTDKAAVLAKAILYANANVDLRYSQSVKFYLSPFNLSGTSGDITLTLKTYDWNEAGDAKDYWHNYNYYVAISMQNLTDGSVVNITPTCTSAGAYVVPQDTTAQKKNVVCVAVPAITSSSTTLTVPGSITGWGDLETSTGLVYKLSSVPSGTYNLVVRFVGSDKSAYYTEKIIVLPNRAITQTLEIPNVIGKKPKPVSGLRVGYNDPDNADSDYYLATFLWDDNSNNEEGFILQLVDLSNDTDSWQEDGTVLGLAANAKAALTAVAAAPSAIVSSTYSTDFATVKTAWDAEVTSAKLTAEKITGMSLDYTVYQKTESLYAAGSLNKNSTSISLWLPLGSVYMARICAYNDECGSLGATDAAVLVSDQEWYYANTASLESAAEGTIDKLPAVYLATDVSTGYVADGYTPSQWPKSSASPTKEEDSDPIAINRYRLTYNLNGGSFWKLHDKYGRLESVYQTDNGSAQTAFTDDTNVTSAIEGITGIGGELTKAVEYHTVTAIGTDLISPIAYQYDTTNSYYATLFKNNKDVWTAWKKDSVDGTVMEDTTHLFRDIKWKTVLETGADLAADTVGETTRTYDFATTTYAAANVAADPSYYIASKYGYVSTKGYTTDTTPTLTASSTITETKAKSTDGTIMIRSSLPNYMTYKNLNLFAEFTSTFASVEIYSPDNYDLSSANIRVMKSSDASAYVTANVYGTSDSPTTGTYTDFELNGTSFLISTFYKDLRFKLLDYKNIYKKAKLEILYNGSVSKGSIENTLDSAKFTVDGSLVGSGTGNKDPLNVLGLTESAQFVFDVSTTSLAPGKYTALLTAYTTVNETTGFTYPISFEVADPTYTAYTACTAGDTHTELFETTDAADVSKYYRSSYTSYDAAAANSVTVYYGSTASY